MGRQTRQARRAQAKLSSQPVGIFKNWLSDLKALPPDAEEWTAVDSFIEDLTDVAARNMAERLIRQSEQIHTTVRRPPGPSAMNSVTSNWNSPCPTPSAIPSAHRTS